MGCPCVPLVRWVRHRIFGKRYPPKRIVEWKDAPHKLQKLETRIKKNIPPLTEQKILVIIPTNGEDIERLNHCISALESAAKSVELTVMLIVSPCDSTIKQSLLNMFSGRAFVRGLPGDFNYVRSLNTCFKLRTNQDAVLFLNDDCFFEEEGGLDILMHTLIERGLSCVGPWIIEERSQNAKLHKTRPHGFHLTFEPLMGCCMLWSWEWLLMLHSFDERFGEGYGLDEGDHILRISRLGGLWGIDSSVSVLHKEHATFGKNILYSKEAKLNQEYWKVKYRDIPPWGGSKHWIPYQHKGWKGIKTAYSKQPS